MDRITSGIAELDFILAGGLPKNSLNVIAGSPGAGKTILAQQLVYANARGDAPALYLTTLSESASKMLRYLQEFTFFNEAKLLDAPAAVVYRDIAELVRANGLAALPALLVSLIDEYHPSILVIDSFKALHDLGGSPSEVRRALFDIAGNLAARPCTTLLIGEYTAAELGELPEFAIADGIIHLVNRPYGMRDERYLRILKMRGSSYLAGEHSFRITEVGFTVFPRLTSPRNPKPYGMVSERVSTGIAGLDRMLDGGLRRGSSTLVVGASGSGKTLLGLHFLFAGTAVGEDGLLVSFQENPTLLREIVETRGWNPQELAEGGRLTSLYVSPVEMNIDDIVRRIIDVITARPVRRVVIDSIGDLELASTDPQRFQSYLYALIQLLAVRGITGYVTKEDTADDMTSLPQRGVWYVSDNVIALRYTRESERPNSDPLVGRSLAVIKTRGSGHDPHIRRMVIGPHTIEVGAHGRR